MAHSTLSMRTPGWHQIAAALFCALALQCGWAEEPAKAPEPFAQAMTRAQALRAQGQFQLALQQIQRAQQLAISPAEQTLSALEAGALLLSARKLDQAETWLKRAAQTAAGHAALAARVALETGNLYALRRNSAQAQVEYRKALVLEEPEVHAAVAINLLRLSERQDLLVQAPSIRRNIDRIADPAQRAAMLLRLSALAQGVEFLDTRRLVFHTASAALLLGRQQKLRRVTITALDQLGQLYEQENRPEESLALVREALALADPAVDQDLLINLQWRSGRLQRRLGHQEEALQHYIQAVDQIEAIRFDIPVTYDDGRSSFRETLEPIYLGLTDLLLQQATNHPAQAPALLRRARNAAEGIKQSELQDYMGDLCTVASARQTVARGLPADTAVLYPVIFEDRVETILETAQGIQQVQQPISGYELRALAYSFASELRNQRPGYLPISQRLYQLLVAPSVALLKDSGVRNLVVVPDGPLRMVPYAALHDGERFLVERFAVSISPSLGLTQSALGRSEPPRVLVSGLSEPGPVVDELLRRMGMAQVSAAEDNPTDCGGRYASLQLADAADLLPAVGPGQATVTSDAGPAVQPIPLPTAEDRAESQRLRDIRLREAARSLGQSLRLPGVMQEVAQIAEGTRARVLLDQQFTLQDFSDAVQSGQYNVIHIASHGVFGGSGDNSYLLAWDKVITMDALQSLIQSDRLAKRPIDLMTLSACETADGDDRAPLGISGAALKARARSVVGTLWPVADEAAQQIMVSFYGSLQGGASKTEALRQAQQKLLQQPQYRNPFYWAPFSLVGAWQ